MDMVWVVHPNLPGQETQVAKSAVPILAHSGWLLMDGPPEPKPAPEIGRADVHGERYETSGAGTDDPPAPAPAKSKSTRGARASDTDEKGDH